MTLSSSFRDGQMGVYIHWPFCAAKCPYCDFNSHVRERIDQDVWADAYVCALEHYASLIPDKQVVSIFFGGGTPSLMRPDVVARIIDCVQRLWRCANDIEISLEANPTSVEIEKFQGFRDAGVNRVSLGIQALNDSDLKFLGREHSAEEGRRAIDVAASVFDRVSFDLMYGRPDQTLLQWESELEQALKMAQGHLSLYQLTIERNTPFYMRHTRGEFEIPDEVRGAEFYHLTQDVLEAHGYPAYEVSNHAVEGQECRHNLVYWRMADYIGVGAGAHGRFMMDDQKYASRDHAAPESWLKRVQEKDYGAHDFEVLSAEDRFHEALMMGLRLRDGVSVSHCEGLSGLRFEGQVDMARLETICAQGWASCEKDHIKLSREGTLRLNALVHYLLK